jgi:hypothetical protein
VTQRCVDRVDKIGRSSVQHGPFNNRAYLMKLDPADVPGIVPKLRALCEKQGYSKVFAKVPASERAAFEEAGYREEATIPGLYGGSEDAVLLALYLDPARAQEQRAAAVNEILELARAKAERLPDSVLRGTHRIDQAGPEDVEAMGDV